MATHSMAKPSELGTFKDETKVLKFCVSDYSSLRREEGRERHDLF